MNDFFNLDNPIFVFLGKVCDILFLSVIWVLLCIPVFTIGPAITALYYVTVKVIRRERGYLFREFFKSFKSNFKNGAIIGILITITFLILFFDHSYAKELIKTSNTKGVILLSLFNVMIFIMLCFTIYVFPVLSRFTMKKRDMVKTSFIMSMKHLPSTIVMAVVLLISMLLVYIIPISIFIVPGLATLVISLLMERIFKKYIPKSDDSPEETGIDEWYLE